MNDHHAHDREGSRTRRSVLSTAGGLLLPASLLIAGTDDAEATKKAKRRRRRRPGMFANDVIINFRNATSATLSYYMDTWVTASSYSGIAPGKESGFAAGIPAWKLTTRAKLYIRLPGMDSHSYMIDCYNPEVGPPWVIISWYSPDSPGRRDDLTGVVFMSENERFEISHLDYRFAVHRWSNGKEPLDRFDEWYTRFFVTMSEA